MKTNYIDIDEHWGIILIHHFDEWDYDDMEAIMTSFGLRKHKIEHALKVLSTFNSGMTISNDGLRMSAVFIGNATSDAQWWNSIAHEAVHVSQAILDFYREENWKDETPAYLQGYIFQKIVEEIGVPCR